MMSWKIPLILIESNLITINFFLDNVVKKVEEYEVQNNPSSFVYGTKQNGQCICDNHLFTCYIKMSCIKSYCVDPDS